MGSKMDKLSGAIREHGGPDEIAALDAVKVRDSWSSCNPDGVKSMFNEAGGGDPLKFDDFYPLLKEALEDILSQCRDGGLDKDDVESAFKDLNEDGSGAIDADGFMMFVYVVGMMAAANEVDRIAKAAGLE